MHIPGFLENFAKRERYVAGVKPGCGYLVKKRLKLVIIIPVDN